jgi:hypothetical protein
VQVGVGGGEDVTARKRTVKRALEEVPAASYISLASSYHDAASALFSVREQRIGTAPPNPRDSLLDPIYFLYFHTVELALKAFIRAHGREILGTPRASHKLTELYEECRTLGLVIGTDGQLEIGNIVSLLESGNKYQGFRYFNIPAGARPEVAWTREVVDALMRTVEPTIETLDHDQNAGKPVVIIMTVGRPRPQARGG